MDSQRGFTLLEVLFTLSLFSIALIGLGKMHLLSMQANQANFQYQLAYAAAHNLSELLYALPHDQGYTKIIQQWQSELPNVLPQAKGEFRQAGHSADITVSWQGQQGNPFAYCEQQRGNYCISLVM